MKIILLCLTVLVYSCTTYKYNYKFDMQPVSNSDSLMYENDSLKIRFEMLKEVIKFRIDNKTNQALKIVWDEASFSIDGKSYKVAHKLTGTTKVYEAQPPSTIPPKSYLIDGLIPVDGIIYVRNVFTGAPVPITKVLFPTTDYGSKKKANEIMGWKGLNIAVHIPIYFANNYAARTFSFTISDIKKTKDTGK